VEHTGLDAATAQAQLQRHGPNRIEGSGDGGPWLVLRRLTLQQLRNPLVAILAAGAGLATLTGSGGDALLVLAILAATGGLSVWQEWRADQAMQQLQQRLAPTTRVWRSGVLVTVPTEQLVPDDLIDLRAGDLMAADAVLLESNNLLVVESMLTGESMPVEKRPQGGLGAVQLGTHTAVHGGSSTGLDFDSGSAAALWAGTSVRSGTGTARVQRTGMQTRLAAAARPMTQQRRASPFQQGVADFGALLMRWLLVIVVLALVGHALHGRPVLEGLVLAMALAVGLSPEMLPVIVSVTLSQGARRLAQRGILVRRLDAMEDLGSLDVLCADKTGTLTLGCVRLHRALDLEGRDSEAVLRIAACNARLEAGMANPLDEALVSVSRQRGWFEPDDPLGPLPIKLGEIPYDFERRRLSVLVREAVAAEDAPLLFRVLTKGAAAEVLSGCTHRRSEDGAVASLDEDRREAVRQQVALHGGNGLRVLAVATRVCPAHAPGDAPRLHGAELETGMVLEGLLLFEDPPREDAVQTVRDLRARGLHIKLLTGDNRYVAQAVARAVGLPQEPVVTGQALTAMREEELWHHAARCSVFAEIAPQHKALLVRALQRHGHVVGFIGDGINDAPALRAADVGISVQGAADVARHSADLVLTRPDLEQVALAVDEGRRSFGNTRQYVAITSSANFGNMVSMAAGGWLLPFAPMTAHQILLNNLLSDLPAMTVPQDPLDPRKARHPQRWDLPALRRFMWAFGLLSTAFDLSAFALLWQVLEVPPPAFQTAWFLCSLATEIVVLLLLRGTRAWWGAGPTRAMGMACAGALAFGLASVLWTPLARVLGFESLSGMTWVAMAAVVLGYALATEALKRHLR
jgi:P-type Mg2+ transporter